jgi:hypothetical protein
MSARKAPHRRRVAAIGLAALAALAMQLALAAGSVDAFIGYTNAPNAVFGAPGSGNGQFSSPLGVAVDDSSGDVYVVDQGNDRIEKFDAEGKYLAQITGAETPAGSFSGPRDIAVDNSSSPAKGDVYVTDVGHSVIDVFSSAGKYLAQIMGAPTAFGGILYGVAVDASGNVWAYDRGANVDEFSDTGSFLKQFNTGREANTGLAVDSDSDVYLLLGCGCLEKYSASGALLAEWSGSGGKALAVNEQTNNVFLDTSSSIEEFGALGEPYGVPVEAFGSGAMSAGSVGVDGSTGTVYVSSSESNTVAIFKSLLLPDVTTGGASEVTRTSAKLEGVVDPDGQAVTSCELEYGTSTAYGQSAPCTSSPGSGSSPVAVSAVLSDLTLATTYHYRVAAGNANGSHAGTDATFTTSSAVEGVQTSAADEIQSTSATLTGSLEPNGFDTHYVFEYGLCDANVGCGGSPYDKSTTSQDAGSAGTAVPARSTVSGLEPNATYHFRIVAENSFGTTGAAAEHFTTVAAPAAIGAQRPPAITRVTATLGWMLNPENSETTYQVLYGATSAYGEHTEAGKRLGYGEEEVAVGLSGLAPETTYHYALQATNQAGTVTGPDETLTTGPAAPPTATTGEASEIALTSATVFGTIDPDGLYTSYEIDFGTDTSYGTSVYGEAGAGTEGVTVSAVLQNLAPDTTYHYRIVAINSDGKVYGSDQTFTTPVYSNPIVLPSTLPLVTTPAIAFPTETEPTQKAATKKAAKKKHKQHSRKRKARRTPRGSGTHRKRK